MPDVLPPPNRLDVSDRALVARCADGDLDALQSLFHRHAGTVWGCAEVAARREGAPHAEEIASRAFIAVWHEAKAVLAGARTVEASLLVAVARLGLGRPAFG